MTANDPLDRRDFIKRAAAVGVSTLAASRAASPMLAFNGSPAEKMVVAVMGLNGRGMVPAHAFARGTNTTVGYLIDVDSNVLAKATSEIAPLQRTPPKAISDFRRALDDKNVDALIIAAPDHWHTPATILALDAGKHVYVEKPSGHDPREDELIVAAARKHSRLKVQLGTQARSGPHFIEALHIVRDGLIGTPYLARGWYANTRASIGHGKIVPVPSNLDYALWQGPAPRTPYRDNVIHYNWHWFTRWGTGEICNNGTHELDVARWLLGVDYPTTVDSVGTRKHFDDDWEFPDAQEATYEFEGGKTIVWHGQSCNGLPMYGRPRGTTILGTNGSMIIDQDGYVIMDVKGKTVKDTAPTQAGDPLNTVGDDSLTLLHMKNFVDAIRTGSKLNAPIS